MSYEYESDRFSCDAYTGSHVAVAMSNKSKDGWEVISIVQIPTMYIGNVDLIVFYRREVK